MILFDMNIRLFSCIALLFVFFVSANSQELDCEVNIVSREIQRSNRQLFQTLQQEVREFMNSRNWTKHVYESNEKIQCRLLFNLQKEVKPGEYKGYLQIQSTRPVYNSTYNTTLWNYKDEDLHFEYVEDQPLEFSLTSFNSNLTSILAYYAYVILGMDYDSFSHEGGTEFYQNAETVMKHAQNSGKSGWKARGSSDHKNRYWLINNILDGDYSPVRSFVYKYHRMGLDKMADKSNKARSTMVESLKLLQKVSQRKPDPFMHYLKVIFDAKADEFVKVFAEAPRAQQKKVVTILTEVDPSHASKYEKIMK